MAKRTLQIAKIRLDGNTQPRVELEESLIAEYQDAYKAGVVMPPLEVMFDGASHWLWDGFHRRWGADRAGVDKLPCNVTNGTREDAQWASYSANKAHGLRRTNADKQKAVKAALQHPSGPTMSDSQIAEHCGVDQKTVWKYRQEMESAKEIPKLTDRIGRDGKTYQTANIGKSEQATADEHGDILPDEDAGEWDDAIDPGKPEDFTDPDEEPGDLPDYDPLEPTPYDQFEERLDGFCRAQMRNIDDLTWPLMCSVMATAADNWHSREDA